MQFRLLNLFILGAALTVFGCAGDGTLGPDKNGDADGSIAAKPVPYPDFSQLNAVADPPSTASTEANRCREAKTRLERKLERLLAMQARLGTSNNALSEQLAAKIKATQTELEKLLANCGAFFNQTNGTDEAALAPDDYNTAKQTLEGNIERFKSMLRRANASGNRALIARLTHQVEAWEKELGHLEERCYGNAQLDISADPCETNNKRIAAELDRLEAALKRAIAADNPQLAQRITQEIEAWQARLHRLKQECGFEDGDLDPCEDHKEEILQQLERLKNARENAIEEGNRQAVAEFNQAIAELQIRLRHLMEECGYADDEDEEEPCEAHKHEILQQLERLERARQQAIKEENREAVAEINQAIEELQDRLERLAEECGYDDGPDRRSLR